MRNFWVNGVVDGRATTITGGPVNKDGGMWIEVRQRNNGESVPVAIVDSFVDFSSNELVTLIKDGDGNVLKEIRTKR